MNQIMLSACLDMKVMICDLWTIIVVESDVEQKWMVEMLKIVLVEKPNPGVHKSP